MKKKRLFEVRWGLAVFPFRKEIEEGSEDVYADNAGDAIGEANVPRNVDWVHAKLAVVK